MYIPESVRNELLALNDFGVDIEKVLDYDWIHVERVENIEFVDSLISRLDQGEPEALALAKQLGAYLLIIVGKIGRSVASELNIRNVANYISKTRQIGEQNLLYVNFNIGSVR